MGDSTIIEMLADGTLTWVCNRTLDEQIRSVHYGDKLTVTLVEGDGDFNFVDGEWTAYGISDDKFRIVSC